MVQWQAERGFANVPKDSLRMLCQKLRVEPLEVTDVSTQDEDSLAAVLVMKAFPKGMTAKRLHQILQHRKFAESAVGRNDDWDDDLTQEVMDDVFLPSDRKEALDRKKSEKEAREHFRARSGQIKNVIKALVNTKPEFFKKGKPDSVAVKVASAAKKKTWFNSITPDANMIKDFKPADTTFWLDLIGGRFVVHHFGLPGSRKHISWTRRGVPEACKLALGQMWAWEAAFSGEPCPLLPEMTGGDVDEFGI